MQSIDCPFRAADYLLPKLAERLACHALLIFTPTPPRKKLLWVGTWTEE
jgi:hypothetical protein